MNGKQANCTVIVPELQDGVYFIQNKETQKYVDVDSQSLESGANVHQWGFHGEDSQKWQFTLYSDGYVRIKNVNSAKYLGVEGSSSAQGAAVKQYSSAGSHNLLWKIEKLSDGAYKIISKSGESVNRVLASAGYSAIQDGIDVQQRTFVQDDSYIDEWILRTDSKDYALVYVGSEESSNNENNMNELIETVRWYMDKAEKNGSTYRAIEKEDAFYEIASSKVVSYITHGKYDRIALSDDKVMTIQDIQNLKSDTLKDCNLAVLTACYAGYLSSNSTEQVKDENGNVINVTYNVADALHDKGIKTVIAFKGAVNVAGRKCMDEVLHDRIINWS